MNWHRSSKICFLFADWFSALVLLFFLFVFQTAAQVQTGQPPVLYPLGRTGLTGQELRIAPTRANEALGALSASVVRGAEANQTSTGTQPFSLLPSVTFAAGCFPFSLAVGDLDGDGNPDLVVANWYQGCTGVFGPGSVGVMRGNGDGTFQAPITYFSGGWQALSVALGDLNGDGQLDLVVVNSCPNDNGKCQAGLGQIGVLLGNGDGTFQPAKSYYSGGGLPNAVKLADVNGDGHMDLVVDNECQPVVSGGCSGPGSTGVLLGNGDGTFQSAVAYANGQESLTSLAVGDLNEDGYPDVVVVGGSSAGVLSVLMGNGDGTFRPPVSYDSIGQAPQSVAIADLNGDGHLDVVVAGVCQDLPPCSVGSVNVLLGKGDGTFQAPVNYNSGAYNALSIAVADVSGDGHPDLLVTNEALNGSFVPVGVVAVLVGNGDGTFQPAVNFLSGGNGPVSVSGVDVNRDGKPDVLMVNQSPGNVGVLLNRTGSPQYATTTSLNSSPNPSLFGRTVNFSAVVKSQSGTPTGTVTFYSDSATLGSAKLVNGTGFLSFSALALGTHSVVAVYDGSAEFNVSKSATLRQVVKHAIAATSTTLISSLNPSVYGQSVTFTAAVTSSGGTPPNGEIVTFFFGTKAVGTAPLVGGLASLTRFLLPPGIHVISAAYSGDSSFAGSASPGLRQFVYTKNQSATETILASSLNPSTYGQTVTWTARATTAGRSTPTGRIEFMSGFKVIGVAELDTHGAASLTRANLNSNLYQLTAVYLGDQANGPSQSALVNQVVNRATSTITIISTPNPSVSGEAVDFTAIVTSPTARPTGPVSFFVETKLIGTALLSAGKAKFTTSTLHGGSNRVTATYDGNSNIAGSSASVIQNVQP